MFYSRRLDSVNVLSNPTHKKDCFIFGQKGCISNVINRYGKLKTIFCPIEKLLLSIKREPHIFVFHHVFDIHVNPLDSC